MYPKSEHGKAIAEGMRFNIYAAPRRRMEELWELVKPVKLPNRRRREDRELPKKAA